MNGRSAKGRVVGTVTVVRVARNMAGRPFLGLLSMLAVGIMLATMAAASAAGNLLPNSGFELGRLRLGLGRLKGDTGEAVVDEAVAWEGQRSLRISVLPAFRRTGSATPDESHLRRFPFDAFWVQMEGVRVKPGRTYTLSAYLRGDRNMRAVIGATVAGGYPWTPSGRITRQWVNVQPGWQRITLKIPADTKYNRTPGLLVNFFVMPEDGEPGRVWFDGLQLEPGATATAYSLKSDVDLGVTTRVANNIFDSKKQECIVARVAVSNGASAARTANVSWRLTRWDGAEVSNGRLAIEVPPGKTAVKRLDLGVLSKGYYIGDFKLDETGQGQWLRIAVINKRTLPVAGAGESFFGIHWSTSTPEAADAVVAAGARWHKGYQNLTSAEQRRRILAGQGSWQTRWVNSAHNREIAVKRGLNSFTGFNLFPVWMDGVGRGFRRGKTEGAPQNPEEARAMIRSWVRDNQAWAKHVESINEIVSYIPSPNGSVSASMEYFRLFYDSVKEVDPDVQVMHNVVYDINSIHEYLGPCMKAGLKKYMDILTFHYYGFGAVEPERFLANYVNDIKAIMKKYDAEDIPLWMTEGGGASMACEDDPYRDRAMFFGGHSIRTHEPDVAKYLVRFHVTGLALGVERFFYYLPMDHQGVPSNNDCVGLLRYDGTPRWAYAAYAHMTELLEGKRLIEEVRLGEDAVRFYVFEGDAGVVVVFNKGLNGLRGDVLVPGRGPLASGSMLDLMGGTLSWTPGTDDDAKSVSARFDGFPKYLVFDRDRGAAGQRVAAAIKRTVKVDSVERPEVRGPVPPQPKGTTFFIECEDALERRGGSIDYKPGHYGGKAWHAIGPRPDDGFYARYAFDVAGEAEYAVWIAGWPIGHRDDDSYWVSPVEYRIDAGPWASATRANSPARWESGGMGTGDVKDKWWMKQQPVTLPTGEHIIELRITQPRTLRTDKRKDSIVFCLDAIAVTKEN